MVTFVYKAINLEGNTINGSMEASNREEVMASLKTRGYNPISLKEESGKNIMDIDIFNRVKTKDLAIVCRQFSFVLASGTPILKALEICIDQSNNKRLKNILIRTREQIQRGSSLADCLKYERDIPDMMVNLVATGEVSGKLDKIVLDLADYYDIQYKQEQKIRSALSYPKFVSAFALLVVAFLLSYVVPAFVQNLMDLGGELPLLTKGIIALSDFLIKYWILLLLVAGIVIILKKYMLDKDETYIKKRDYNKLRIPLFGNINKQIISARFARTFSILISSGVPVIQSIEVAAGVVGNVYITNKINDAKEDVKKGNSIGRTLEEMRIFPLLLTQMISLGEETGALEEVLEKTSKFYDGEVENAINRLVNSIEPIMIIVLAVIVLIIILAMILPLTSMMEAVNNIPRN